MNFKSGLAGLFICLAILIPAVSQADINATMDSMFGSMINITAPSAHLSARRGIIDSGSIVVRNRVANVQLVAFNPPRVSGGCGGIDAFMGSFSFINADAFVNALRAVAANAVSYAFNLALGEMCPSCKDIINDLRTAAAKINQWGGNTCKMAELAIEKTIGTDAPGAVGKNLVGSWLNPIAERVGVVTDGFAKNFPTPGEDLPANDMTALQRYDANLDGNIAYRVLTEGAIAPSSWITGGDSVLVEELISITGTVIISQAPAAPDSKKLPPVVTPLPALLSFKSFVGGFKLDDSNAVEMYQCDAGVANCMRMTPASISSMVPMAKRVENVLLGDGGSSAGIVAKFAFNIPGSFTNDELSFMSALPDVAKHIRDLSMISSGSARIYAKSVAQEAGFMLAERVVDEILTAITIATAQKEHHAALATYIQQTLAVRESIKAEKQLLYTKIMGKSDTVTLYKNLMATNKVMLKVRAGNTSQGATSKR